jgi:anti-anti-sigma factor
MSGSLLDDTADGTPRFQLQELVDGGEHTLVLAGEVDMVAAPGVEEAVGRLCVEGTTRIVLNLREVTFIDSSGLRAILAADGLCRQHGCEFSLVPGPEQVQSLFEMTGVAELLPFQTGERPHLAPDALLPKLFAPVEREEAVRDEQQ